MVDNRGEKLKEAAKFICLNCGKEFIDTKYDIFDLLIIYPKPITIRCPYCKSTATGLKGFEEI